MVIWVKICRNIINSLLKNLNFFYITGGITSCCSTLAIPFSVIE